MKGPHKAVRPSPDGFGTGTTNPVNEKTSQSNTSYARGFIVWSDYIGGNFELTIAMSKLAQLFGTIFHVQEPFIFLLLSRDMRRGVYKDYTAVKQRLFGV
uniref:Uncharacterized protein n=1 Tax=Meloidogyne javanica TaxID=6303 RepID=A0A915MSA4_MELJA